MSAKENFWALSGYRLPTEAEWEFACRSGTLTSYHYGQTESLLGEYAWYLNNAKRQSWPVASLKPNDFGIFDMHGNVREWCQDAFLSDNTATKIDTVNTGEINSNTRRMLRGGSYSVLSDVVRSAYRTLSVPTSVAPTLVSAPPELTTEHFYQFTFSRRRQSNLKPTKSNAHIS